jgi:hypothetical protein
LPHTDVFGISAVGIPAGVGRLGAEVLPAAGAPLAHAAGSAQPRHTDPAAERVEPSIRPAFDDGADDLMAGRDVGRVHRQVCVDDVQVGSADAARQHLHDDLIGAGFWPWLLAEQ